MKIPVPFLKKFIQLKNIAGNIYFILKETINESIDDNVLKLSAALS